MMNDKLTPQVGDRVVMTLGDGESVEGVVSGQHSKKGHRRVRWDDGERSIERVQDLRPAPEEA